MIVILDPVFFILWENRDFREQLEKKVGSGIS